MQANYIGGNEMANIKELFPRGSEEFYRLNQANANRIRSAEPQRPARSALVDPLPGEAQDHGRIALCYRIFRVRLLDQENLNGSTKPVTDCLVQIGLIPDDDPKTIEIETSQEKVAHYSQERTTIHITYP
jgi:hypothetical protein